MQVERKTRIQTRYFINLYFFVSSDALETKTSQIVDPKANEAVGLVTQTRPERTAHNHMPRRTELLLE